jgi:hypothetical protein
MNDLKDVMTHLKHDNVFHTQILLYEIHSLGAVMVLESVLIVAVQAIHDVALKMLQKVDLILEVLGKLSHRIILPDVDSSVASRGDVIKVTGACVKSCKNHR